VKTLCECRLQNAFHDRFAHLWSDDFLSDSWSKKILLVCGFLCTLGENLSPDLNQADLVNETVSDFTVNISRRALLKSLIKITLFSHPFFFRFVEAFWHDSELFLLFLWMWHRPSFVSLLESKRLSNHIFGLVSLRLSVGEEKKVKMLVSEIRRIFRN
jgi:hypothetical protein